MKVAIAFSVLLACLAGSYALNTQGGTLDVLTSTVRIITRLCWANGGQNKNNPQIVKDFFGCYDQAPHKDKFVKCQTQVFGGALDNVKAIGESCRICKQYNLVPYSSCLRRELGSEFASTVLTLNDCQGKVLGLNL